MSAPKTASVRWHSIGNNFESYLIYRSTDGINYNHLATVNSGSYSNDIGHYSYNDSTIVPGTTYYYKFTATSATTTSSLYHTQSIYVPTESVPYKYPMSFWFQASSFDGILSGGDTVGTMSVDGLSSSVWYDSYPFNYDPLSGSAKQPYIFARKLNTANINPIYRTDQHGTGLSGVVFSADQLDLTPRPLFNPPYLIAVCYKGNTTINNYGGIFDGLTSYYDSLDIDIGGARRIGGYTNNTYQSHLLSSSFSQSQVVWWNVPQYNGYFEYYENAYSRGCTNAAPIANTIVGPCYYIGSFWGGANLSASIAEICVWTGSFTSSHVIDLFYNYFLPKYGTSSLFYTTPEQPLTLEVVPIGFNLSGNVYTASLSWSLFGWPYNQGTTSYLVYKSSSLTADFELLSSVGNTFLYNDMTATTESIYHYKIQKTCTEDNYSSSLAPITFIPPAVDPIYYGAISFWSMDEPSGWRRDLIGTNHLYDNNTVSSSAGKVSGSALFVAASSEYLNVPSASGLDVLDTGDWTIQAWVSSSAYNDYCGVVVFNNMGIVETKNTKWGIITAGDVSVCGPVITNSVWTHVVARKSGATRTFFINGSELTTSFTSDTGYGLAGVYYVGRGYTTNYYNGRIDQVAVWGRALTPAEITSLYNSGNGV